MELPLSRLDLNLLTVFDMLMQERNVTRAAERLHLSQSTVSHALGRLRQALDDPLFVMSRREMMPTERLVPYARNARTHSDQQVAQIAASIAEFGFTAQQVFPWKPQPKKVAAKYRDPDTGATWSGRGKPPQWIAGKDRTPFVIG